MHPTLHDIVKHAFTLSTVPTYIPTSTHDSTLDLQHISRAVSESNLHWLPRYALLDEAHAHIETTYPH